MKLGPFGDVDVFEGVGILIVEHAGLVFAVFVVFGVSILVGANGVASDVSHLGRIVEFGTIVVVGLFRPAFGVVCWGVVHLAEGLGLVTVVLEMGVPRGGPGGIFVGERMGGDESVLGGANAGEHARARGPAGGDHAIGAFEEQAFFGEAVEVGRLDVIGAVGSEFRT